MTIYKSILNEDKRFNEITDDIGNKISVFHAKLNLYSVLSVAYSIQQLPILIENQLQTGQRLKDSHIKAIKEVAYTILEDINKSLD